MCTGLTIAALAAMAAGTGMQMSAQNKAAKKTKSAIIEAAARQNKVLDDKRAMTMDNLEQYAPEARAAAQEEAATTAEAGLVGELLRSSEEGITTPEATGKVSNEYQTNLAKSISDRMERSSKLAHLMSRFRAPNDMRFEENLKNADFASRQGGLDSLGRSYAATDNQLIQMAQQPDSRLMLLGNLLQTAGSAAAMGSVLNPGTAGAAGATTGAGAASGSPVFLANSSPNYLAMFPGAP